jgi:hypothetical protein
LLVTRPFTRDVREEVVDGLEERGSARSERADVAQVEDDGLLRQDVVSDPIDEAFDVRIVDATADGHHRRELAALRPELGSVAVDGRISVAEGRIRVWTTGRDSHMRPPFDGVEQSDPPQSLQRKPEGNPPT